MPVNHVFFIRGLSTHGHDNAKWSLFDFGPVYKRLAHELQNRGVQFHPVLGLGSGSLSEIAVRASEFLNRDPVWSDPANKVHLFGHSAGGLVLRKIIPDVKRPVASVLTLATPHRGSKLAEICMGIPEKYRGSDLVLKTFGYSISKRRHFFSDLTPAHIAQTMRIEKSYARVERMGSIVCSVPRKEWCLPLKMFYKIKAFDDFTLPSDGVVERDSQPFGEVIGEIGIDHFRQVGLFDEGRRFAQLCDLTAGFFKQS